MQALYHDQRRTPVRRPPSHHHPLVGRRRALRLPGQLPSLRADTRAAAKPVEQRVGFLCGHADRAAPELHVRLRTDAFVHAVQVPVPRDHSDPVAGAIVVV